MMKKDIVNLSYLALELTKIYIENMDKSICIFGKDTIRDTYNYYLASLLDIETMGDYEETKQKLEEITEEYNKLKENMETIIEDKVAYKKDVLKHILDNAKGDMEPYVYQSLIKLVK